MKYTLEPSNKRGICALLALCLLGLTATGCTSLAINNYIKEVRTNPSRATEPTPPTCTNGEEGKRAIIDAFKQTKTNHDDNFQLFFGVAFYFGGLYYMGRVSLLNMNDCKPR